MIKSDADVTYFCANLEQQALAHRLDEAFDVTFGAKHGDSAFWLAAPKPHAEERFGLQKEILTIYSPHSTTDARVLTAIENISRNPHFKHRIDKILVLLIHSGDKVKTEELVKQQNDWVIVPFTTEELLDPARGALFIRAKIAEAMGEIDLFGMSSPIKHDKYFYGREELVQSLIQRATTRKENSGLFGLRKTGKTSVLFAMQRRLSERPVLVEYFDCQNPGIHAARWWQVLENIVEVCAQSLHRQYSRTAKVKLNYTEATAGTRFASDIQELASAGQLDQIVLMFDEVEFVTPELSGILGQHWDKDFLPFWQTIRATHQQSKGCLAFIVAGVNPASVERSHFGVLPNPIFQLAVPHYLEPMLTKHVRDMVRSIGRYTGLSFAEDCYGHLSNTYGGHPYLIRIACSEVWRTTPTTDPTRLQVLNIDSFTSRQTNIRARISQPIKDILLSLVWWYPEEYDVLRILASGDHEFVSSFLKANSEQGVQFVRYGLLREAESSFAIRDLSEFLSVHGEEYKNELSPFKRGDMPPNLLPEVPDLQALGKLFEKRTEVEVKLRQVIYFYVGVKCNWDKSKLAPALYKGLRPRQDRPKPAQLFTSREPRDVMNELFTQDLKHIALEHWDAIGPLFEKNRGRFEMNMDSLNKARRVDAHAKLVSPAEVEEILNSYHWLLGRLNKVPIPN